MLVICDELNRTNPNTAAGITKEWDGSWKFLPAHLRLSCVRTRSMRSLAGSKSFRPKYNWSKKRKAGY